MHCLSCGFINILFINFLFSCCLNWYIYNIHSQLCSQHLIIQTTNESGVRLVESKEKATSIFLAWVKHTFFSLSGYIYIVLLIVWWELKFVAIYRNTAGNGFYFTSSCHHVLFWLKTFTNMDWNGFDWRRKAGTRCMHINRRKNVEWVTIISFRAADEERKRITAKTRTR